MKRAFRYAVIFAESATGYAAYVPDLPGCVSVGDTLADTEQNIRKAILGHLRVMQEFGDPLPEPKTAVQNIEVEVFAE